VDKVDTAVSQTFSLTMTDQVIRLQIVLGIRPATKCFLEATSARTDDQCQFESRSKILNMVFIEMWTFITFALKMRKFMF